MHLEYRSVEYRTKLQLSLHVSPSMSMLDASIKRQRSPFAKEPSPSFADASHTLKRINTAQSTTSLGDKHKGETVVDIISDEGLFEVRLVMIMFRLSPVHLDLRTVRVVGLNRLHLRSN